MCGIAGIVNKSEPVDKNTLELMADLLQHRGPDAKGFFQDNNIGLVHTRLSIVDLSGGNQPLVSPDKNLVLVANGEIYNHLELRQELELKGYRYQTHSDCESILYAYQEWGSNFLEKVYGMFAFALFDHEKQQVVLARDRLGIKPLFFIQDSNGVRFASELKALLLSESEKTSLNGQAVIEYLNNNFTSARNTLISNVQRVLPGESVTIAQGKVVNYQQYWQLTKIEPADYSQQTAEKKFDELMESVVTQHLRSDVPVGIFLSGGVDSAVTLSLIRRYTDQQIKSYSVGFPDSDAHNELAAAHRIAELFETEHTELELEKDALLNVLPATVSAADELMGDYANLPTWLLAQRAAEDVKVVFTGEGGDEVFAGYGRYRIGLVKRLKSVFNASPRGSFRKHGMLKKPWVTDIWNKNLSTLTGQWSAVFDEAWAQCPDNWSDLQKMQYTDIKTWLCDDLLVKADRMLMAHGVEGRVPFLDHRVVEFGLALPDNLKIQGKTGKFFLKKWAEKSLPFDHLYAKKKGFTVPVKQWVNAGGFLRRLGHELENESLNKMVFDHDRMQDFITSQLAEMNHPAAVWAITQLVLWLEIVNNNWRADEMVDKKLRGLFDLES